MSYAIRDAETGEIVQGGLSYRETELFREHCPNLDAYVIEDEPEPQE